MPTQIGCDEVRRLVADGAQLVDVLPEPEFQASHLPSAINIPLKDLTRDLDRRLDRRRPVVVYCFDSQ